MNSPHQQRLRGILFVLTASFIWGTIPLLLRQVDGSSLIKVFFRVFFACIAVSAWLLVSGRWRKILEVPRSMAIQLLIQGVILGINWMLFLGAFERASVAVVELLGYMGPVFVTLLAPLVIGERFDKRILVPLALSLTGMVVILAPHGLAVGGSSTELVGALMAAGSAVTYSILMLRGKRLLTGVDTDVLIWFEYVASSVLLLPFALYQYAGNNGPTGGLADYGWLAVLGIVHTGIAGWLFFGGLKRLRADQTAIFTYLEPVSAIVLAAAFLGESITVPTIIGGALVVVGGTIVARLDAQHGFETHPIEVAGTTEGDT